MLLRRRSPDNSGQYGPAGGSSAHNRRYGQVLKEGGDKRAEKRGSGTWLVR